jgi:hypothetical protein
MVRGGLLSFPWNPGHSTKKASRTGRRLDLGKMLRDLAIERKLLELGEGKMSKVVMSLHELSLAISGAEVDMRILFKLGVQIEGEWPHPCPLHLHLALPL